MKNKVKLITFILFTSVILFSFTYSTEIKKTKPTKYIFLFIGDGMGVNQSFITNNYLQTLGKEQLCYTLFPHFALTTTYCLDTTKVTDSAAAGTAIATGKKTQFGAIGMNNITGEKYTSIAEIAKANQLKVGILSTVGINHATPASFYGNQPSRGMYIEIADQMKESNFDLFAGGGIMTKGDTSEFNRILSELKQTGYQIISEKEEFSKEKKYADKVYYSIFDVLLGDEEYPFAMDYKDQNIPTLADFTDFAIKYLDNEKGFFMMVEGGKIDWACHGNEAAAAINEVIAFNEAIKKALAFYETHKDETLIIVTADHETGGMSYGNDYMHYDINYEILANQKISIEEFVTVLTNSKVENYPDVVSENIGFELDNSYFENKTPEFIAQELVDSINKVAGIGWTTGSHTGTPVGTYSIGIGSELFNGIIDNTDIVKNIMKLTEFKN